MFDLFEDDATLFTIPEHLLSSTPCQVTPDLYTTPALDIDIDDDEWVRLSRDEQYGQLAAKQAAEAAAVAACGTCPLLDACRTWATEMGDRVFGVAGGLTHEERSGSSSRVVIADPTVRGPLGQVRDDLIERWTAAGLSNKQIAERLGCNVRTVERRKAGMAAGTARRFGVAADLAPAAPPVLADLATQTQGLAPVVEAKDAAAGTLIPQRVSAETAVIFDALLDGALRDRSEIVDLAVDSVDEAVALATAPNDRVYPDRATQVRIGARKFLMNRVDIAIRRGRIQLVKTDAGKSLICLEPGTAATWREYRSAASVR